MTVNLIIANAAGEKSDKLRKTGLPSSACSVFFETAAEKINADHQQRQAKFLGTVAVVIAAGIDGDKAGEHGGNHRPCRSDIKRSDFICRKCGCREEKRLNDVNSEKMRSRISGHGRHEEDRATALFAQKMSL